MYCMRTFLSFTLCTSRAMIIVQRMGERGTQVLLTKLGVKTEGTFQRAYIRFLYVFCKKQQKTHELLYAALLTLFVFLVPLVSSLLMVSIDSRSSAVDVTSTQRLPDNC